MLYLLFPPFMFRILGQVQANVIVYVMFVVLRLTIAE
jgi:hypothetical protein